MALLNYEKGKQIKSIADFEKWLRKTNFFIVDFKDDTRVIPHGFIISWQYKTLTKYIYGGKVFVAKSKGEKRWKRLV